MWIQWKCQLKSIFFPNCAQALWFRDNFIQIHAENVENIMLIVCLDWEVPAESDNRIFFYLIFIQQSDCENVDSFPFLGYCQFWLCVLTDTKGKVFAQIRSLAVKISSRNTKKMRCKYRIILKLLRFWYYGNSIRWAKFERHRDKGFLSIREIPIHTYIQFKFDKNENGIKTIFLIDGNVIAYD